MSEAKLQFSFENDSAAAEIIHMIGKWKIIDLKNLYEYLNLNVTYRTLKTKVNNLEKRGLVASKFLGTRQKYVYLPDNGIAHTPFDKTYGPVSSEVFHDLLVGRVVQEFSKYSKVLDVTMYHLIEDKYINPDAVITLNAKGKLYRVAIEIELTRKSQSRIKSKFSKYGNSQDYDFCFYISNDERLLTAYKMYLDEFKEEVRRKIFFITDSNLGTAKEILKNPRCIHKGQEVVLESIIGGKLK